MIRNILKLSLLLTAVCFLQSCLKDECTGTQYFLKQEAVWFSESAIRTNFKTEDAQPLKNPGKIYSYGNYIFINEQYEGIHIIDNTDNRNPQRLKFIPISGNVDMAVKGNILYADNIIDLLSIDISNPLSPELITRTENIFDKQNDGNGNYLAYHRIVEDTLELNCTDPRIGTQAISGENGNIWVSVDNIGLEDAADGPRTNTVQPGGIAGSMASFAIYDCYLYVIDQSKVDILDLRDRERGPDFLNTFYVAGGIETLFPYKDKLFIGSESGMFIYDNVNPIEPIRLGSFTHARACDPVVVKDNYAFVTLRDGTFCEGFENQLDVVDITDLLNPRLVKTYPMDNPHGLAVQDNELYLCDGASGLKVFDITDVNAIDQNQIEHVKDIDTYDAIALPGKDVLLVIGADGFYQYDISDPENLIELSLIAVEREL